MENKQLKAVYNGNETIMNAGFTMQSNYVLPVLTRMIDEKLINKAGAEVVQAILTFKHTEEMPYPTRETIAMLLGKTVEFVKKALASIKASGILAIVKSGRKSKYDFAPFFALLEKFIVEFKNKKNHAVKIADLLKMKVQKKETGSFEWSEKYQDEKEVVAVAEEAVEEVVEEAPVMPVLPEELASVLKVYEVSSEGAEAVEKAYTAYKGKLDVAVFIEKVVASAGKKEFGKYFTKCITNAYVNGEQPTPKQEQKQYPINARTGKPSTRVEVMPSWYGQKEEKQETYAEQIEKATCVEDLAKIIESVDSVLELVPNNVSALENKAKLDKKIAELTNGKEGAK